MVRQRKLGNPRSGFLKCHLLHRAWNHKFHKKNDIQKLFHQLLIPEKENLLNIEMDMADSLIKEIPFYVLTCNMSEEAAITAYNELSKI